MTAKMRPEFYALHAHTLEPATTEAQLRAALEAADAFPERRRLAEAAVYTSALRRWLMLTGTAWRDAQQPDGAASWDESDHRYRERQTPEGYRGECSCGAKLEPAPGLGPLERAAWHTEHRLGGVPA